MFWQDEDYFARAFEEALTPRRRDYVRPAPGTTKKAVLTFIRGLFGGRR